MHLNFVCAVPHTSRGKKSERQSCEINFNGCKYTAIATIQRVKMKQKKNQHHDQKERKYCNVHVCTVYDKMYEEAWSLKKSFKKRKSNEILMVFERVYVYIVCLCMRRTQSRNRLLSKRTIECMHIAYSRSSSESRKKNEAKAKDKEEKNEYIK